MPSSNNNNSKGLEKEFIIDDEYLVLNKQPCYICGKSTSTKRLVGWIVVNICSHHDESEILNNLH